MNNKTIKSILYSLVILSIAFAAALGIQNLFSAPSLVPAVFVLAVFLISLLTSGYIYGLLSAFVSVLAVNYAFTFPFFEFNFTIQENAVSAIIMIVVTTLTCALTKKIKHQDQLKAENEKEKVRANLLRAISHDLRTPLTAIYGSASTICENYDSLKDSDKLSMLYGIMEDSQWLIRMVENLLSVTRFDNKNVKIIKSSTALEELIDSCISKFNKRYPEIKVHIDIPEDFVSILCDALLIEQVIINLLENAVQHAKGMTKLSLKVFTIGSDAIFEVSDNGEGIDKETLKNLFTSFSKTDYSDSKSHSMGIGLSVCSSIINAHGGSITAENSKTGGAIFRFTLKKEDNDEQ